MTGRPPTLSSGLGVANVWGRKRLPFPARGMMAFMELRSLEAWAGYGRADDQASKLYRSSPWAAKIEPELAIQG